jgi:hypothetical protein
MLASDPGCRVVILLREIEYAWEIVAGAAPDLFSAVRSLHHVEVIAHVPHPTGSPENTRVRDYIVHELQALGIGTAVERATGFYRDSAVAFRGGMVENIVGRVPGSANTRAVMHRDTAPVAPKA